MRSRAFDRSFDIVFPGASFRNADLGMHRVGLPSQRIPSGGFFPLKNTAEKHSVCGNRGPLLGKLIPRYREGSCGRLERSRRNIGTRRPRRRETFRCPLAVKTNRRTVLHLHLREFLRGALCKLQGEIFF